MIENRFFKFTTDFEAGMDKIRGKFVRILIEKQDGTERELVGVLIRSKKNVFCVDEGTADDPSFRAVNVHKIKAFTIDGIKHTPKEKKDEEKNT